MEKERLCSTAGAIIRTPRTEWRAQVVRKNENCEIHRMCKLLKTPFFYTREWHSCVGNTYFLSTHTGVWLCLNRRIHVLLPAFV